MGITFSKIKTEETYDLININLKIIGFLISLIKKENVIILPECAKCLEKNEDNYSFYNGMLQCLANIEPIKDFFLDRKKMIKLVDKDCLFIEYFYRIVQDMWYSNDNENDKDIYNIFLIEIQKLSESNNILKDFKLLIESLLLKLQNEINKDKNTNEIKNNFKLNKVYENPDYNYNSFIQYLFFFKMEYHYNCKCKKNKKYYSIKCTLDFDIDEIPKKEDFDIYNFLNILIENKFCEECNKKYYLIRKIYTCPEYLIIIIKQNNNFSFKFKMNEEIDIGKYTPNEKNNNNCSIIYELISFINNKLSPFCKSPKNNLWIKYKNGIIKKMTKLKEFYYNPYILIYKKKNRIKKIDSSTNNI